MIATADIASTSRAAIPCRTNYPSPGLAAAAHRGVIMRVISPGKETDNSIVLRASRARWGPMLQAGTAIAEYQPTMFYCNVLVADDLLVSVGSTISDPRSCRLNDEAIIKVLDATFARQQTEVFESVLTRAKVISLEAWKERPWTEKLAEQTASWVGAQL